MRKLLLSFIFSTFVLASFSQKYLPGYILTNDGDTIHGELLNQNDANACIQCILKNSSDQIKTFLPKEINEYRYQDGKYYVSREIEIDSVLTPVFLNFLLKGTIELYVYYTPVTRTEIFYVLKDNILAKLENNISFIYRDGVSYRKYDKKYIGALQFLYSDAPEVIKDVEKLSFSSASIIKISEEYHNYVCNDESCEIYKRKRKKIYFGVKPLINYNKTTLSIYQKINNHTYNDITTLSDDQYYNTKKSYEYKSNYAYSYGLGFNIFSPDKRFKVEYSFGTQFSSFNNTQIREHFPLQISEYSITPDYLHTLSIKELIHDFEISYAFTYNKIQPYISYGVLSSKVKTVESNNQDINSIFPYAFRGPIYRVGIKYNSCDRIIIELSGYYSSLDCRLTKKKYSSSVPNENYYLMDVSYKQLGLNLGATFFLFSNSKKI